MKPAVCRAFIAAYEQMMGRSITYPTLNKQVSYRWLLLNQMRWVEFSGLGEAA